MQAIKEFTELGSGFKIAMRDLSIRGAGNILGSQQHGFIDSVGFDLYSQMLQEAIAARQPKEEHEKIVPVEIDITVDAYIPEHYIQDGRQKIEMYKRFRTVLDMDDLEELRSDMMDRFGDYPEQVEYLFMITELKVYAMRVGIESIKQDAEKITIQFSEDGTQNMRGDMVMQVIGEYGRQIGVGMDGQQLRITVNVSKKPLQEWLFDLKTLTDKLSEAKKRSFRIECRISEHLIFRKGGGVQMAQKTMKNLMKGAVWLTLASLLSKILSAVYRIPFQNMVGDIGFYIFQQVYPIYGIAMTLALAGFPIIVSRLVAEEENVTKREEIFQSALQVMMGVGLVFFLMIFFGAEFIARVMGDVHLTILIRVISFSFLLMPFLASFRGFFQGHEQMIPTAVSQTIEQLVRVIIIIAGATGAAALGWNLYMTGAVAMSGAVIGGLGALGTLLYFYWRKKPEKIRLTKKMGKREVRQALLSTEYRRLYYKRYADSLSAIRLVPSLPPYA